MSDFEQRIQSDLRHSELYLYKDVRDELQDIRRHALAMPDRWWSLRRIAWPTTGMALASLVALVLIFNADRGNNSEQFRANENYSDGFDLYENLDFYYWLASRENDLKG